MEIFSTKNGPIPSKRTKQNERLLIRILQTRVKNGSRDNQKKDHKDPENMNLFLFFMNRQSNVETGYDNIIRE